MKRRRFESLICVYAAGWTAICEENKAWHLPFRATEWIELPDLPPIDDSDASIAEIQKNLNKGCFTREEFVKDYDRRHGTDMAKLAASFFDPSLGQPWPEDQASDRPAPSSEPVAYQGLGRQDLPIRDWANLAGKFDRVERLLINSIADTSIDAGYVVLSLIEEIRNELGLPRPAKAAQ